MIYLQKLALLTSLNNSAHTCTHASRVIAYEVEIFVDFVGQSQATKISSHNIHAQGMAGTLTMKIYSSECLGYIMACI